MTPQGNKTQDMRLSVRLTPEERLEIEARANGQKLSAYVRRVLLGKAAAKRSAARPDDKALGQILGLLGQSNVFQSLADLSECAKVGALPEDEDIKASLTAAQTDLAEIKSLLMQALRTKER